MSEPNTSPAVERSRGLSAALGWPRVLLDGDGDIWASWDGGRSYHYITPHGWGPGTELADLQKSGAMLEAIFVPLPKPDAAGRFVDHWEGCGACQEGLPCPTGDPLWLAMQGGHDAR